MVVDVSLRVDAQQLRASMSYYFIIGLPWNTPHGSNNSDIGIHALQNILKVVCIWYHCNIDLPSHIWGIKVSQ